MRIYHKIRRELYKLFSQLNVKQAKTNYFGLDLKVPLIQGLGSGYLAPADKWMSDCLAVFLQKKQGTVIDIGVNIGLYLVKLRAIDSDRDYIGFEPNAVCNYYTQELVRANEFKNTRIFPFALADERAMRQFYVRRQADKMGSLNDYARFGETDKYAFELCTFPADEFVGFLALDKISAIKIDVEGSELEVLTGLVDTIKTYKPYMFCEIWQIPEKNHPTYQEKATRLKKIFALLEKLDYQVIAVSSSNPADVEILDSIEKFDGSHRPDYILAHQTEAQDLLQSIRRI